MTETEKIDWKIYFRYGMALLLFVGLVSIFALFYLFFFPEPDSMEIAKLRIEVLKIVLPSVVIGLLGILIPNWLAQRRHELDFKLAQEKFDIEKNRQEFEEKIEGRRLYSIVKTGLDYLPERLSVMDTKEALEHLEAIHQAYHLVMLYPDDEKKGNYESYFAKKDAYNILMSAKKTFTKTEDSSKGYTE